MREQWHSVHSWRMYPGGYVSLIEHIAASALNRHIFYPTAPKVIRFDMKGPTTMKKIALAIVPLALILALALIGCGKVPGTGQATQTTAPGTVGMDATNFTVHTVTIKAGDPIHFDDTVNGGGTHFLCLGTDQQCDKSAQGPQQLTAGFTINPGSKMDVTFSTPGTYKVTCTLHANMNVTVTVQ